VCRAPHRLGSKRRIQKAATVASAKATAKRTRSRRRTLGYVAQSGATRSAANFVHPASATRPPRAHGDVTSQNPKTRNAGMTASFVSAFSA